MRGATGRGRSRAGSSRGSSTRWAERTGPSSAGSINGRRCTRRGPKSCTRSSEAMPCCRPWTARGGSGSDAALGERAGRAPARRDARPAGRGRGEPGFSPAEVESAPTGAIDWRNAPSDPAHILFTSGSTGMPKGVVITHANVTCFIEWAVRHFGLGPLDRTSGHAPLHFGLSTFDVFGSLAAGAALHLVPHQLNLLPHKLAEFIRTEELTQWFSVPSVLHLMAKLDVVRPNDFPALKRLLWCGEVFYTPALRYWMRQLPHAAFTNLYGPTEATIASSHYTVPRCPDHDRAEIPIGRAG